MFQKTLFSSFGWQLFFLSTIVLKSYQKKLGSFGGRLTPPHERIIFCIEITPKIHRKFQKYRKFAIFSRFFEKLFSIFEVDTTTMVGNHISKHFALIFHFPILQGGQNGPILVIWAKKKPILTPL